MGEDMNEMSNGDKTQRNTNKNVMVLVAIAASGMILSEILERILGPLFESNGMSYFLGDVLAFTIAITLCFVIAWHYFQK